MLSMKSSPVSSLSEQISGGREAVISSVHVVNEGDIEFAMSHSI